MISAAMLSSGPILAGPRHTERSNEALGKFHEFEDVIREKFIPIPTYINDLAKVNSLDVGRGCIMENFLEDLRKNVAENYVELNRAFKKKWYSSGCDRSRQNP